MRPLTRDQKMNRLLHMIDQCDSSIHITKTKLKHNIFRNAMIQIQENKKLRLKKAMKYLERNWDIPIKDLLTKHKIRY